MSLPVPNLDDRDFETLLAEALQRVKLACPTWTDFSPSDPGVVILEAFAYLTDLMIYRLNRVPIKVYIELLNLMGIKLYPPSAARAELHFKIETLQPKAVQIPRLTRVTTGKGKTDRSTPVFVTAESVEIPAGSKEAVIHAYHVDYVQAELAAVGTGEPGQTVTLKSPPVVAPIANFAELLVGIEVQRSELTPAAEAVEYNGKAFRVWREVESFSQLGSDRHVYTVDRVTGVISFAPAIRTKNVAGELQAKVEALAEIPPAGKEIRVWYASGGGPSGNVTNDVLTVLKDAIPGVTVTNPEPAMGGVSAETVENALIRGPQELHSLERAVTARDFEMLAARIGGAARAKAFTQSELWVHARPGTVEVKLVPNYLEPDQRGDGSVTADNLSKQETPEALAEIRKKLDDIKPLGTRCEVDWVRYKTVRVQARVVIYPGESRDAVQARVLKNLNEAINPLPTSSSRRGWKFGEPLRVSRVYDIILAEPGVSYVDSVSLLVDDVPNKDVRAIVADAFQLNTWYACAGSAVYRSMNDAQSWERVFTVDDVPTLLFVNPDKPGFVAMVTRRADDGGSRVFLSTDCMESTPRQIADMTSNIEDIAWLTRNDAAVLLMATDTGLYEISVEAPGAVPVQVLVDETSDQDLGLYSVVAFTDYRGGINVAVSAQRSRGVYLSVSGGAPHSFRQVGLENEDVRVLVVQPDPVRDFLWAGLAVPGNEPGKGAFRLEVTDSQASQAGWRQYGNGWIGGSCYSMAFSGEKVFAATHHSGVVAMNLNNPDPSWIAPQIACGLPTRDVTTKETKQIFQPVAALATAPKGEVLLVCGREGVLLSGDSGKTYRSVSNTSFSDRVAIPDAWLFCSGAHEISVATEDEESGD